jgi:hypothetical protein
LVDAGIVRMTSDSLDGFDETVKVLVAVHPGFLVLEKSETSMKPLC